jgi:hypothetical protein
MPEPDPNIGANPMSELTPQSTSAPTPPPLPTPKDDAPPAAVPPVINPEDFEDFPAFREAFLLYVSDPAANAVLRGLGELLHNLILEYWHHWPEHPEGLLRASLRAAVADLRYVQGFLLDWASPDTAHNSPHEEHLGKTGGGIAREIAALADRLEKELGPWRGETGAQP